MDRVDAIFGDNRHVDTAARARWGRIGANESWARTEDRAARTLPARMAALQRFERQVDPEGKLTPQERALRAEHARKAHFQRMALKSAQARKRRGAMVKRGSTGP